MICFLDAQKDVLAGLEEALVGTWGNFGEALGSVAGHREPLGALKDALP